MDMLSVDLKDFDFIIATPPCNYWSRANCNIHSAYSQETKHLLPDILIKLGNETKPFIVEHGRHSYFSNYDFSDIIKLVPQQQDFKYGGKYINKGDDRQGGSNVNNVFIAIIKEYYKSNI